MKFLKDHAVEIIQWLWPPLARHLGYAKNTEAYVDDLTSAAEGLKCKRKDIQGEHDEDGPLVKRRKLTMMTHEAKRWISESSNLEREVDSIKSEFDQRRTAMKFLNGRLTYCFFRYRMGKRAARLLEEVQHLQDKGPQGEVAVSPPRPMVVAKPESLPPGQSTSERTLDEIWHCLREEETRIVCVYGMGGIGKTTLMRAINNKLIGTRDFDIVLWVTVSKEYSLERIQKEIANELGLDFYDGERRTDKLFAALKDLKFMLILDDLWREFDLEEAGIPIPNEGNGCKIAVTTRFVQVSNAMEADKHIRVNTLTDEESWNLFCEKAGEAASRPEIQPLAQNVAMECGGLPIAIITVGGAMRGKYSKDLWLDALRALRGSAPDLPGMGPKVFNSLKLSYECLENEKLKRCFLYCALFPEDYNIRIRKLIRFWTMEGYIDNVESFEDASNKGHAIIERIKEACLLEEGLSEDTYVKMHDLIRDLAIWITSSSPDESKFLVRARLELKVPPKEEMWEDTGRMSLMWNDIEDLPTRPNCPKLETLLLRKNIQLSFIPNGFFELMPKLQILELSYTHIESLPMSLSSLVNLRALILKCCRNLVELPPFGRLKELQFLDISSSAICNLPEGFENLVKLKQLNLSGLDYLVSIPYNVLSKLSSLEDLRLLKTYVSWSIETESQVMYEATLGEVATLTRLTTFDITIPNIDCLEHDVFRRHWPRFKKYGFHIGSEWIFGRLTCDNSLHAHGCDHFPDGIKAMIKRVEGLGLAGCSGMRRVSQLVGDAKNLKQLQVYNFVGMDCVIDWGEVGEGTLERLEWLCVDGLLDLTRLFGGQVPQGGLRSLRSIEVSNCEKLTFLFSSSAAERLDGLEELVVRSCDEMMRIIEGDALPENAFPRLRRLRMERLYKLTSIVSSAAAFPNLQGMEVFRCPLLKKLPFCAGIQMITGERGWWDSLEWDDENAKSHFLLKYKEWILPQRR